MKVYIILSLIIIYISVIRLLLLSGCKLWQALIPFYNILLFCKKIYLHYYFLPIIIAIFFTPDKSLIITILLIVIPFIIADAYGVSLFYAILLIILPPLAYPLLAFKLGYYNYKEILNNEIKCNNNNDVKCVNEEKL